MRSTYEGDDIRDLIRSRGPPMIPNLPLNHQTKANSNSNRSKSTSTRNGPRDAAAKITRQSSRDRALHRRTVVNLSSSEEEIDNSDTHSTTDTENDKIHRRKNGSVDVTVNQLKDELKSISRYSNDTRRGGIRDAFRRGSERLVRNRRSRSSSREPPGVVPSSTSIKNLGKDLFGDRQSRGTLKPKEDPQENRRSRARSKTRFRSKSKLGFRSKSKTPKLDPRSRSESRTRKHRERSESRTRKNRTRTRSESLTRNDKTRARSESRTRKDKSRARSESRTRKDKSRARSESRTRKERKRSESRTPKKNRSRGKSVKSNRSNGSKDKHAKPMKRRGSSVSILKRDPENDDGQSDISSSLAPRLHVSQSLSMDSGSIDSMARRNTVQNLPHKTDNHDSFPRRNSSWFQRSASASMDDSPMTVSPKRPPISPGVPTAHRTIVRNNSNQSEKSENSGLRLPKKDWKATLKHMFNQPKNEEPVKKEDPEPEMREWQNDLTNLNGDDQTVATFERLWDREQEPSVHQKEDETTIRSDQIPASTLILGGTKEAETQTDPIRDKKPSFVKEVENSLHEKFSKYDDQLYESEVQIQGFKEEVASLQKALEAKDAAVVAVRAQLDTSIDEKERHRSETQGAILELQDQVSDLRDALVDRETKVESLQRQLDMAYSENNQEMYKAEVQLKDFREKMSSLDKTLDERDAQIDELKGELERANNQLRTQMDQGHDDADQQLKDFREQVAALQEMVDEKMNAVNGLQIKLEEADSENKIMLEELDVLLQEKTAAEAKASKAANDVDNQDDIAARERIKELEKELEDATNVANLQLEELDEQVDELKERLKAERHDSASKIKSRDSIIDELTIKLRKYEAVPSNREAPSSSDSVASGKSGRSGRSGRVSLGTSAMASFAFTDYTMETPEISTDDVTDINGAKQKVYEARADATAVRESLEITTKKCAELILANEALTKRNSELVDTTWERDSLKDQVRDWTAQTYNWKRRAEEAESKLAKMNGSIDDADSNADDSGHQGNMIAAAMGNRSGGNENKTEKKSGWSLFGRSTNTGNNSLHRSDTKSSDGETSGEAKDAQIVGLNEVIAKLRSELVQMSSAHKEEVYLTKKRITHLEGENEALKLKNDTLEQISRFHSEH